MIRHFIALSLLTGPAFAQEITAPSGLTLKLYDVILEDDVPLARFRFEVPEIAGNALAFTEVADDLQALCDDTLLPGLVQSGWTDGQIILQLSAQQIAFGVTAPEVTQYFQPFTISGDTCIWEDF